MGGNHGNPVSDPVDQFCGEQVDSQLYGKIEGRDQCDAIQRQDELARKSQKQKRGKVVYDGLGNISDIAGIDSMVVVASDVHAFTALP